MRRRWWVLYRRGHSVKTENIREREILLSLDRVSPEEFDLAGIDHPDTYDTFIEWYEHIHSTIREREHWQLFSRMNCSCRCYIQRVAAEKKEQEQ